MSHHGPVPDPASLRSDYRLVTYNILYQGVAPAGYDWEDRCEAVIAELTRLTPDIIAFQEVWLDQLTDLQAALSDFSWIVATDTPAHTPIAYRTARFDRVQQGTFWLSPPAADPGAPGWDAAYQRRATYVTLVDRTADNIATVMNVHLDHEGERARRKGVELVRSRLTNIAADGHILLAGDFNAQPGDPAFRRARSAHKDWQTLRNAEAVATTTDGTADTYVGFPEQTTDPRNIDHIFVSSGPDVTYTATCVPPSEPEDCPSDHRPVLADFSLEGTVAGSDLPEST